MKEVSKQVGKSPCGTAFATGGVFHNHPFSDSSLRCQREGVRYKNRRDSPATDVWEIIVEHTVVGIRYVGSSQLVCPIPDRCRL